MDRPLPADVVGSMLKKDLFSQWLGIELIEISEGYSKIQMTLRPEMVNGFGIIHGGIPFSLADSAFAFACNSRNTLSLAIDTSINFLKKAYPGDILEAEAKEIHNGKTTGLYQVEVKNQQKAIVALFKGTCFRTHESLIS